MWTILSYTTSESEEELFIILMKSKDTVVIKVLGKYIPQNYTPTCSSMFIHTAFKMREEHNVSALELPLT